jgi:3-oxoadipate enol-lactonase
VAASPPELPNGYVVELPGRGQTWVYDTGAGAASFVGYRNGAARVLGERRTLVLLHGWTSTAALNWFCCFSPLAAEFRVVALDQRGHGRGLRGRPPFRLEDCADDVAALIEQLQTGPVTAVGYSMGGAVAQLLAQRHPGYLDGLVLCATAARFSTPSELNGPLGALGYGMALALSSVPANLRRQSLGLMLRNRAADRGLAPWAIAEWERNDPAALAQAGFSLSRFDSTPWIGAIDIPTSVVVTTLDLSVPPSSQWYLAQHIPGATGFPVAGTHRACVEQAGSFTPVLLAACRAAQRTPAAT